jgi:hypothetical protein
MALFTDSDIVTLQDLLPFEASLVQIASSHGINVETKINLSIAAAGDKLLFWLLRAGMSDPQWVSRRLLGLSTVVVTPTLHRWLCFDALSRFYSEAYYVQLNTRFEGKWTEYQAAADEAFAMVANAGIGIVYNPLPQPLLPLASVQSGSLPAQALFIQTAWVDRNSNEGALSPINGLILAGANNVVVQMAEGVNAPKNAIGWNIYASATGNDLTRQNGAPLTIGSTWQLPTSGVISGPEAIGGQQPDYYVIDPKRIQRG